jgi:site-specific recombinase XerD
MNVKHINNTISIEYKAFANEKRGDCAKRTIYLMFRLYNKGILMNEPFKLSTGIVINSDNWSRGALKINGRNNDVLKHQSSTLNRYLTNTLQLLEMISAKCFSDHQTIWDELKANARVFIIGKQPKGKTAGIISRLQAHSYEFVVNDLVAKRKISIGRRRGYNTGKKLLEEYFNGDLPPISEITTNHLIAFKRFVYNKSLKADTKTDYLSKVAATFKYAKDELGIIQINPLPPKFRGTWSNPQRTTLTIEECQQIVELTDHSLTTKQQFAKYALLTQLLTGMGFGDLATLSIHQLRNTDHGIFLQMNRGKTNEPFTVPLSEAALSHIYQYMSLLATHKDLCELNTDKMTKIYKKLGKLAGVKTNVTTYVMRHTFAVQWLDAGGAIEDLQKILGHTDLKTTAIYARISGKRLANQLQQVVKSNPLHNLHSKTIHKVSF